MVNIMEQPSKMDDLGAHPYFWKHPYMLIDVPAQDTSNSIKDLWQHLRMQFPLHDV